MEGDVIRSAEEEAEFLQFRARIQQWKAGMDGANRLDLEVARQRTPAKRFENHQAFLDGDARYGLACSKPEHRIHKTPYHEIQERWLARHPQRIVGS